MNANANLRSKDGLAAQLLGVEAEWKIKELVQSVKDWQITHGSLLKVVSADEEKAVSTGARARGVPVSLVPTPWPRRLYEEAVGLQKDFNELYARLATNDAMLEQMLAPLVEGDEFTGTLWSIYEEAKRRGITQKLCLGIFRSDYMAEVSNGSQTLRQVEFNTFSCSGGTHANLVSDMHQYLHKTGAYGNAYGPAIMSPVSVPKNSNISGIIQALTTAHKAYCAEVLPAASARQRGILIIVQHANFNIGDERPLEYALWDRDIPVYRVEWRSILQNVSLGPNQELLYTSASCPFSPLEISIVYYRAGYHPAEYMDEGVEARLMLETSKAIKCPSILTHLTTFKHIQQELTRPGILNELVSQLQAKRLSATFMPMYALDESESGLHGRELALKEETAHDFILKPSLEGGGNNIYGSDIPEFLTSIAEEAWPNFTLMKKINADTHQALLLSSEKLHKAPTVSELGIIGTCLWRHGDSNEVEILLNEQAGWTFKTKPDSINEMSVVKGYGFFDSPYLVDD